MADDGKTKFSLKTEVNVFGEFPGKKPPKWMFFTPSDVSKIKPIPFKRDMLLDARKWKMKDLVDGVYAVSKYDIAIFSTSVSDIEKKLVEACNKLQGTKHKKADPIAEAKDAKKNKDLQKLFKEAGGKIFKSFQALEKKVNDKVSLALDEVEADKGDNKKSIKSAKDALRKFGNTRFNKVFALPMTDAGKALTALKANLKNSEPKAALEQALKKVKEAESDFEKESGKAKEACHAVMDMGEAMAGNKNSDPSMRKLGETIDDGTAAAKALEKIVHNIEDLGRKLDDIRNDVAKALKSDDDEKVMNNVANTAGKVGSELTSGVSAMMSPVKTAATQLKKFQTDFNKLEKELKK